MRNKKNSCYKCNERKVGCHQNCEKYKEFCKENEEEKKRMRIYKTERNVSQNWSYCKGRKNDGK